MSYYISMLSLTCLWLVLQNDLVMAWGLDFQLQSCIDGAPHEHIGIVDTQWVVHNKIPSLGSEVCANLYSTLSFNQHNKTHSGIHRREVGDSETSRV